MAVQTRLPWQCQCWHTRHGDFEMFPDEFVGKAAKFGGHSLNRFDVIQFFSRRELQTLPLGLNTVKVALNRDRISSVGRALDCGAGGRGFDSRDWTNTQGLKIAEEWRCFFCPAKGWNFEWLGWILKMAVPSPQRDVKILPSFKNHGFQNEAKCTTFLVKIS